MLRSCCPPLPCGRLSRPRIRQRCCSARRSSSGSRRPRGACSDVHGRALSKRTARPAAPRSNSGRTRRRAAAVAQIRACAAGARRDCFCSRAGAGRAIAMATVRSRLPPAPGDRSATKPVREAGVIRIGVMRQHVVARRRARSRLQLALCPARGRVANAWRSALQTAVEAGAAQATRPSQIRTPTGTTIWV